MCNAPRMEFRDSVGEDRTEGGGRIERWEGLKEEGGGKGWRGKGGWGFDSKFVKPT